MATADLPVNLFSILITGLVVIAIMADISGDLCRVVRGRNVVLIGIITWFLVEAIQVPAELGLYTQQEYDDGVLYVGLALVAFLGGYTTPGCPTFLACARKVEALKDPQYLWRMVLICSIIGLTPIAYYTGTEIHELFSGILGMRKTWGGLISRGRYGGLREALLALEMFVIGIGPFAMLLSLDPRAPRWRRIIAFTIATWPLIRAYGSGTRSSLLTSILPILAIVYWKASTKNKRILVLMALLSAPLLFLGSAAMVTSRNSGQLDWSRASTAEYNGYEMFRELLFIVRNVPSTTEYQLGNTYYVQICNPIPRFLWAGKPSLDAGILLAQMHGYTDKNGVAYMTNSPGLIGEMYLNFGLIGIGLLSCFGGWLVKGWDRILEQYETSLTVMVFYSAGLAALFVSGRAFFMPMFYWLIVIMLGVTFVPRVRSYR